VPLAGYSGTPLAKKLSLKPGLCTWWPNMPESVRAEIGETGAIERSAPGNALDAAHLFVVERTEMERLLADLRPRLTPAGFVWVSWPKKASKVPTEITEATIREVFLPMGYVDVKVCAVDETWSGLKLVIRKELR
jgi:hypothetical protein